MTWTGGIVLFVLIWWVIFFCALPWGVRRAAEEELGHDAGAPQRPLLLLKAVITTGISIVLFGIAWWLINSGYVSFY